MRMRCLALMALLVPLSVAGCAAPGYAPSPSPCAGDEASYDCQVERYRNVDA